jgi:tetraacyldisaccharide 4'-kinase
MKFPFLIFSFLYQAGCQIKNWLYGLKIFKPKRAPLPVISVGNISFGGTEKTPMVIRLLEFLVRQGLKPALVTRGYKGRWEKKGGVLSDGKSIIGTWQDSGDEPFMVAQNRPEAGIFIGKNRLLSCQRAKQSGFEVAILDDGFQHRRLQRDMDIVLFDPARKIALREPFSSLKRADILLIKKHAHPQKKEIEARFPETSIFEYSVRCEGLFRVGKKEQAQIEDFKKKKIIAFCGIARPERFISTLKEECIEPLYLFRFPDHHPYPPSSVEKIRQKYQALGADAILTTEKDAVKLVDNKSLSILPIYYLKIELEFEKEFYPSLAPLLQNKGIII